ncbi:MAG: hypothetical protein HZB43_02420 [candidate division Zixibacteria bacterium]|nr:hypothetical protein [candidate division Zixibacteria bacterium]
MLTICEMTVADDEFTPDSDFAGEVRGLEAELKTLGKDVLLEGRVQAMRTMFRAMPDMDPTRYRPSSEALVRRFSDSGFFRINPLVDTNNLLSARLRIPLGIYDLGRLPQSPWVYRIGHHGESYQTFSGQPKNAAGKLVLADSEGVFGSPVADSGRASISPETRHVAVVGYLPLDIAAEEADRVAGVIEDGFNRYFNPVSKERQVILNPAM